MLCKFESGGFPKIHHAGTCLLPCRRLHWLGSSLLPQRPQGNSSSNNSSCLQNRPQVSHTGPSTSVSSEPPGSRQGLSPTLQLRKPRIREVPTFGQPAQPGSHTDRMTPRQADSRVVHLNQLLPRKMSFLIQRSQNQLPTPLHHHHHHQGLINGKQENGRKGVGGAVKAKVGKD